MASVCGCGEDDEADKTTDNDDDDDIGDDDAATPTTTTTVAPTTSSTTVPTSTTGVTTTSSTTVPSTSTSTSLPTNTTTTTTAPTTTTSTTFASTSTTTVATTTSTTTTTIGEVTCYEDADGDGFGIDDVSQVFVGGCPVLWAEEDGDCDDADPLVFPGAPEFPDDVLQNCEGEELALSDDSGVFVSVLNGDDASPGTMDEPVRTVARGIELAVASGKVVFIAVGLYLELLAPTVSLFGGYDAETWMRDDDYVTWIDPGLRIETSLALAGIQGSGGALVNGLYPWIDYRAGMLIDAPGGHVSIRDYDYVGHYAGLAYYPEFHLSGVYLKAGSVVVVDSTFRSGLAYAREDVLSIHSAGFFQESGSAVLTDDSMEGGWVLSDGEIVECAGIEIAGGRALVDGNRFFGGEPEAAMGEPSSYAAIIGAPDVDFRNNTLDGGVAYRSYGLVVTSSLERPIVGNTIRAGSGVVSIGVNVDADNSLVDNLIDGAGGSANSAGVWVTGGIVELVRNDIRHGPTSSLSVGVDFRGDEGLLIGNVVAGGNGPSITYGVFTRRPVTLVNNVVHTVGPSENLAGVGGVVINPGDIRLVDNVIEVEGNGSVDAFVVMLDVLRDQVFLHNLLTGTDVTCLLGDAAGIRCHADIASVNDCENDLESAYRCGGADGNIDDDPAFLDPALFDFHIAPTSPCRDAGVDPAPWYDGPLDDEDFDGDARPYGASWDIGADEWTP